MTLVLTPPSLLSFRAMNAYRLVPLLLCALFIGASSRKMLSAEDSNIDLEGRAQEHQRILAELEQVHQLRERMLQEGTAFSASSSIHCLALRHPVHCSYENHQYCSQMYLCSKLTGSCLTIAKGQCSSLSKQAGCHCKICMSRIS